MKTLKQEFVEAVDNATAARRDGRMGDEMERLWQAVEVAREWLYSLDMVTSLDFAEDDYDEEAEGPG